MVLTLRPPGRAEFAQAATSILRPAFPTYDVPGNGGFLDAFEKGDYRVLAAFDEEIAGNEPVGLVLVGNADDPAVQLIAFFAVNQKFRGHGIGSRLLKAAVMKLGEGSPRLILIEVEDPLLHGSTPETGDPHARLRFYRRHSAGDIDLPYTEPIFDPRIPTSEGMLLFAIGGTALDEANRTQEPVQVGAELSRFLTDYVASSAEPQDAQGRYRDPIERMLASAPDTHVSPSRFE